MAVEPGTESAVRICNKCGTHFQAQDICPHCLATGEGEVSDYHYETGPAPSGEGDASAGSKSEAAAQEGDLEKLPKSKLSALAENAGVPKSGTKADIAARLQEEGHG